MNNRMNFNWTAMMMIFLLTVLMTSCQKDETIGPLEQATSNAAIADGKKSWTNQHKNDRMLLVLCAPSVNNTYYQPSFQDIVDFQVNYAKAIIGNDNVVILVDAQTKSHYEGRVPEDVLLEAYVDDIWMRDFTTVNPLDPIQFTYTDASMSLNLSKQVQQSFIDFAYENYLDFKKTNYWIDGGNIVDNYEGRIITTDRFLEDNFLNYNQGVAFLKDKLKASEVAILPADDEVLAHADGMVMWVAEDVLLVNDYSDDPAFRKEVMDELNYAFPNVEIIELPLDYSGNGWGKIQSACGININSILTFRNLYVPTFGMQHEAAALDLIEESSDRNVIEVNAEGVCEMGGSVRCLTWQVAGKNAKELIRSAREH